MESQGELVDEILPTLGQLWPAGTQFYDETGTKPSMRGLGVVR